MHGSTDIDRTNLVLGLLLMAAAALVAVAVWIALAPAMHRAESREPTQPRSGLVSPTTRASAEVESAGERLDRLLTSHSGSWARMVDAGTPPTIEQALLDTAPTGGGHHARQSIERPNEYRPVAIVLHATGSGEPGTEFASLSGLRDFFARGGVASHYAVDRNGAIMQYVADDRAAFHVAEPGWNGISIGIELLNDNTGDQEFTAAQVRATYGLVTTLGDRYGISADAVVRHSDIQADRLDPAANFPWDRFAASLSDSRDSPMGDSGAPRERLAAGRDRVEVR